MIQIDNNHTVQVKKNTLHNHKHRLGRVDSVLNKWERNTLWKESLTTCLYNCQFTKTFHIALHHHTNSRKTTQLYTMIMRLII